MMRDVAAVVVVMIAFVLVAIGWTLTADTHTQEPCADAPRWYESVWAHWTHVGTFESMEVGTYPWGNVTERPALASRLDVVAGGIGTAALLGVREEPGDGSFIHLNASGALNASLDEARAEELLSRFLEVVLWHEQAVDPAVSGALANATARSDGRTDYFFLFAGPVEVSAPGSNTTDVPRGPYVHPRDAWTQQSGGLAYSWSLPVRVAEGDGWALQSDAIGRSVYRHHLHDRPSSVDEKVVMQGDLSGTGILVPVSAAPGVTEVSC